MMVPKLLTKKTGLFVFFIVFTAFYSPSFAQPTALRLFNSWNINRLYTDSTFLHTTWKPVLYEDTVTTPSSHSWLYRKFFEEHLLNIQRPDFTIYGDIIVDEYIGYNKRPPSLSCV